MVEEQVEGKKVGVVSNYFDHVSVAAIKLEVPVKVGDKLRFVGGETDFEEKVGSMQIHHDQVEKAKAGEEVGIKVSQKVHKGYRVYKV
jgi:putative protease